MNISGIQWAFQVLCNLYEPYYSLLSRLKDAQLATENQTPYAEKTNSKSKDSLRYHTPDIKWKFCTLEELTIDSMTKIKFMSDDWESRIILYHWNI